MRLINGTVRAVVVGLMLTMMLGVGLAAPISTARAQDRDRDLSGRWDRTRLSRYAFALGYNRGYEDAAEHSYRSYRDVQRWREGAEGWQDPMGNRTIFRDSFRRGFAQGFMDGRANRARRYSQEDADRIISQFNRGGGAARPVPGQYDRDNMARIADQNGYRDGLRRGRYDSSRGQRMALDNVSQFRTALNGYRSQYGDRDSYRQAYRDGFRRGYDEAFHGR
jgi:hypothetical protein